ncbi:MAG: ABC transporter permease [Rhodospirillales bacterium]|nr:ABC transporter permease [Rhodospirillales bacterium]
MNLSAEPDTPPLPAAEPRLAAGGRYVAISLLSVLTGLLLWEAVAAGLRSSLLPTPAGVVHAALGMGVGVIARNFAASLRRIAIGYAGGVLLAIPVGLLVGWYRGARLALDPWIQFLRNVPPLALIPFVIVLFGIGELPKYLVIGLAAFLPVTVALIQGVIDADHVLIDAARVLGANQFDVFLRVVIPGAMPVFFVGLRIALGNCWGTLVAAELIASRSGLGYMISQGELYFNIAEIFIGIVLIGLAGLAMDRLFYLFQQRLTAWQERR